MSTPRPVWRRIIELLLRVGIGAAFIYAGWIKTGDPVSFADSVASFAIAPHALIVPFALALPIFEMSAGVLLIIGWPARVGALALILLTGLFCVALLLAIARGLQVNCGCFGPTASTANPWMDVVRDLFIFAGCVWLYREAWLNQNVT